MPTKALIAERLQVPLAQAAYLLLYLGEPAILDATLGPNSDGLSDYMASVVADVHDTACLHLELEATALQDSLRRAISKLSKGEKRILTSRYGLDRKQPRSLEQVVQRLGIVAECVLQIGKRALAKRQRLGASYLEGWCDARWEDVVGAMRRASQMSTNGDYHQPPPYRRKRAHSPKRPLQLSGSARAVTFQVRHAHR